MTPRPIHHAEREALDLHGPRALVRRRAAQRMMSRLEHGLPHCIVEPQAGTPPQIQVVGNLPEEFYLRNGEKPNLSHRAKRVALAKTSTASMGWTLPLSYSEAKGKT